MRRRSPQWLSLMLALLGVMLISLLVRGLAQAQPSTSPAGKTKVARPNTAVEATGCVTADCHGGVKSHQAVHGPVGMNACDACHKLTDVKAHTYELRRKGSDLCTFCHEFSVVGIPVVHAPVAKGECLGCHNPHGGVDRKLTREKSVNEMCARCHESVVQNRAHIHDPVKKGACDSCHTSHASRFPKLLYAEGDALCLSCHDKFRNQLVTALYRHEALNEGCARCHESHASHNPKGLKQPVGMLCVSCHDKIKDKVTSSKFRHSVMTSDRGCLTCHTAHGGDMAKLMADTEIKTCMTCHNEKVKTDRGAIIPAMPELADPKTNKHGPIADGQCAVCHEVHGSNQPLFLPKTNTDTLYQKMAAENYRLCFSCHDIRLGQDEFTQSATGFRNGDENLHFAHVNKGDRGRNCRICHSTHASHSDRHINEIARFGQWEMPINFKKNANGGSCQPGCHEPYDYDRVKPIVYPATRPTINSATRLTTRPATRRIPPTALAKPQPLNLNLIAIGGQPIKIPQADRPTVMLFTRTGLAQQAQFLALVARTLPDPRKVQVVLVVGGEEARVEARKIAQAAQYPWSVVADPNDTLFGRLEVHVFPTTLVIAPDGAQSARIAGVPESLASALPAHLEFASGRIDLAALAKRLSTHNNVGDTPQRRAQRSVVAANHLFDQGKFTEARELLIQAGAEIPHSVPLKAQLARVHTRLGDFHLAMEVLKDLDPQSLAPGEKEVMIARVHFERRDYHSVRQNLAAALKLNPGLAEAHYLMGRVYEIENQWPDAAKSYRTARELEIKEKESRP